MKHQITIINTNQTFQVSSQCRLLRGMEQTGQKGIPVGCREGGCGVCKIKVLEGSYQRHVMSRAHISIEEESEGIVLACRITPTSDLTIQTLKKMTRLLLKNIAPVLTETNSNS